MTAVGSYLEAASIPEALAARRAAPGAAWLAGGTLLLAGDFRDKPESVIDLGRALPRGIGLGGRRQGARQGGLLSLGAGASFQELAESPGLSACLVEAALTMANRNTRNRATIGGNLAADKSCSSLVPLLIVLEAEVEAASPGRGEAERLGLESWLREREAGSRQDDLLVSVSIPLAPGRAAAYRRWNRSACDLSVVGAAVAYSLDAGGALRGLRLALGGMAPHARRFPEIEALLEGSPLPPREEIEAAVAPLLHPIDDLRASAAFKRLRYAQLVADALRDATPLASAGPAKEARR